MSDSKAVATVDEGKEIGKAIKASPEYQKTLMIREAAKQIQQSAWGNAMTPAERNAVAVYAVELDVDPVKHIDMLGGKPYLNAECYFDKFNSFHTSGGFEAENITQDTVARQAWGVPACANAAYLIHVWKDATRRDAGLKPDVTEVGYAPKSEKKSTRAPYAYIDSIGMAEPHKTARTRGARRALRTVTPIWSQRAEVIERKIALLHAQAKVLLPEPDQPARAIAHLDDPYGDAPQLSAGTPDPQDGFATIGQLHEIAEIIKHPAFDDEERESTEQELTTSLTFEAAAELIEGLRQTIALREGE